MPLPWPILYGIFFCQAILLGIESTLMSTTWAFTAVNFSRSESNAGTCAEQVVPVADAYGWQLGRIVDPFGHEWGINQQVQKQSPEETQTAADEFFAKRR